MKLLLDENLSPRLVQALADLYPGSEHVEDRGLGAADDLDIWEHAKTHRFAIVSKDSDFWDRSVLANDSPKIIWIRLGNCSTRDVEWLLRSQFAAIKLFLEEGRETCLLLTQRPRDKSRPAT